MACVAFDTSADMKVVSYPGVEIKFSENSTGEIHVKIINNHAVDYTVLCNVGNKLIKKAVVGDVISIGCVEAIEVSGMYNTLGETLMHETCTDGSKMWISSNHVTVDV